MASLSDWLSTRGITAAAFGRRIGCDRGTVGRYTRGERFPDPPTLIAIRDETAGAVTSEDMLATWQARNPGRVPVIEDGAAQASTATASADRAVGEVAS